MDTEDRNAEQYFAPKIEAMNILPEGVFCDSVGETESGDVLPE